MLFLNLVMDIQFILNDQGEKTSVIITINEYEGFLHKRHQNLELTEEYKIMIDEMMEQEAKQTPQYLSLADIKKTFNK